MIDYLSRLAARSAGRAAAHTLAPINHSRVHTISRDNENPFEAAEPPAAESPFTIHGQPRLSEHARSQRAEHASETPLSPPSSPTQGTSGTDSGQSGRLPTGESGEPRTIQPSRVSSIRYQGEVANPAAVVREPEGVPGLGFHGQVRQQKSYDEAGHEALMTQSPESRPDAGPATPGVAVAGELKPRGLENNESPPAEKESLLRPFRTDQVATGRKHVEPMYREQKGARDRAAPPMAELLPKEPALQPLISSPVEQPRLTIGRLVVEVVPAEPVAMQPQPRRVTTPSAKPQSNPGVGTRSRLRFGLGQI